MLNRCFLGMEFLNYTAYAYCIPPIVILKFFSPKPAPKFIKFLYNAALQIQNLTKFKIQPKHQNCPLNAETVHLLSSCLHHFPKFYLGSS
jgi:hypothetical protein